MFLTLLNYRRDPLSSPHYNFEWPGQGGACCFWGSAWKGGKAFGGISEISTRGNETPGEKWLGRPYAQPMVQQVSLSKKTGHILLKDTPS